MADVIDARVTDKNERYAFASLLKELKCELVEFLQTRAQLLFAEIRDKAGESRKIAALGGIALVFGSMAFLLLTLAAVALVAVAFWGSPFAFFWGLLIIGICYLLLGGIAGIAAYLGLKSVAPQKTIKVLRDDKTWVRAEIIRRS